jgi:hypothetical protein
MAMRRAAIDADIFFFSISHKSESLTKRDINPYDIKNFYSILAVILISRSAFPYPSLEK